MSRSIAIPKTQRTVFQNAVFSVAVLLATGLLSGVFADIGWAQAANSRDSRSSGQQSGNQQSDRPTYGEFSRPSYGEYSRPSFEPRRAPEAATSGNAAPPIVARPPVVHWPIVVHQPVSVAAPPPGVVLYHSPAQAASSGSYSQPSWIYYLPDGNSYMLATSSGLMGPYILPPVDMSADAQFGPLAVQRFMGVPPAGVPRAVDPQIKVVGLQQPAAGQGALNGDLPARPNVRPSNAAARDRAWKQIEQGDAEFLQREFARAIDHYRNASAAAADLGEAFFRQAHAMVAMGEHPQAIKAIRRGLLFDPDWPDSEFHLDDVYGDNKPVKNAKLDALEKAAIAHPQDPESQALAGIELFFDDQFDRAAPYLRRADTMYGPQASYLQGFLKKLPPPKAGAQKPGANNPAGPQQKPAAADDGLDT